MTWNWLVKAAGSVFSVLGLVVGLAGCSGAIESDADATITLSGWLAFVGGCVLYGASHVVEAMNDLSPKERPRED